MLNLSGYLTKKNLISFGLIGLLVAGGAFFFIIPRYTQKFAGISKLPVIRKDSGLAQVKPGKQQYIVEGVVSKKNSPLSSISHNGDFEFVLAAGQRLRHRSDHFSHKRQTHRTKWRRSGSWMRSFLLQLKDGSEVYVRSSREMRNELPRGDYRTSYRKTHKGTTDHRTRYRGYAAGDKVSVLGRFDAGKRMVGQSVYGGSGKAMKAHVTRAVFWFNTGAVAFGVIALVSLGFGIFKKSS